MKIEVDISKKYSLILMGLLLVFSVVSLGVAYGTNDPAVFGHSAGEIQGSTGADIPSGLIGMFNEACPSGWTRYDELDDRFPRGSDVATVGEEGGSDSHTHGGRQGHGVKSGGGTHANLVASTTTLPPYRNVVFCQKD